LKKQRKRFEIRPLSFLKYYSNNKKASLAMTLALVLSVFMIIIFQMVIYAVNEPARLGDEGIADYMTQVYPGDKGAIDKSTAEEIRKTPEIERIIPVNIQDVDYNHFFGTCNIHLCFIRNNDMRYIMKKLGLKLVEGRMPVPGKREILFDTRLVNNKNKKLGDFIGKEVDSKEKIPGKYKIVGILEGNCILGLSPINDRDLAGLNCLLLAPRDGQLEMLNAELSNISREKAHFWTKQLSDDNYNKTSKSLNTIFGVMSLAIIFVMAFASGNSSYAQYFSRRYEFGILQSIGYTRAQILLRAAKEVALLNIIGTSLGILLGFGAGIILDKVFFEPHGYPFNLMQYDGLVKALTIPICTALFGLIPAGWLLSRIDPMLVVEKFE
jgi:hypothetical protein